MSGYTFERHSQYCTLKFTPELGDMAWNEIEQATNRVTQLVHDDRANAVLVDLSALENVPSGVVASLVRTWKGMEEKSRQFVVVASHDDVTKELEQTGLTSLWTLVSDHEHAYQALGVSAPEPDSAEEQPPVAAPSVTSSDPYVFEEQKLFCSVQMNPVLMQMDWAAVETATTELISKLKAAQAKSALIDISPMNIINSALVASLVRIWKATQEIGGQFSLVSPNDQVTEVLKSAGLWKMWSVVDDRDEAVYDLGVSKGAQAEQRERRVLVLVAVPCAVISVLALGLMSVNRDNAIGTDAQLNALLLAAAAVATGLVSLFRDTGKRRMASGAAVVVGLMVLSTMWFQANPVSFGQQPGMNRDFNRDEQEEAPPEVSESGSASKQIQESGDDSAPEASATGTDTDSD